nr:MAG TPA: hypothetical protein [Inoviridae sp.]
MAPSRTRFYVSPRSLYMALKLTGYEQKDIF